MCLEFIIKAKTLKEAQQKAKIPLIAKKNITVYKSLLKSSYDGKYYPPYNKWENGLPFTYEKGMEHYRYGNKIFGINHIRKDHWKKGYYRVDVDEGLHSCSTRGSAKKKHGNTVVQMIIPKGASYYVGKYGDIVSDRLIWY